MTWKQICIMGIAGSLLSSIACIIYWKFYQEVFLVDYSSIIGFSNIISACLVGCLLMSVSYKVFIQWLGIRSIGWLNLLFGIISFASIIGVMGFNLPLDTQSPELFPGMVIPMHFFPILSLLTIFPFFTIHSNFQSK